MGQKRLSYPKRHRGAARRYGFDAGSKSCARLLASLCQIAGSVTNLWDSEVFLGQHPEQRHHLTLYVVVVGDSETAMSPALSGARAGAACEHSSSFTWQFNEVRQAVAGGCD